MSKKIIRQFACSKMMLPEHRVNLEEHKTRVDHAENYRSPSLDEQLQEEFQHILVQAMLKGQQLRFTLAAKKGFENITGRPVRLDLHTGLIYVHTGLPRPSAIRAAEVLKIEII